MSKEEFQAFLKENFDLPSNVSEALWDGNIRSLKDLASAERSKVLELVDHPILNTVHPVLQKFSSEISSAENPSQRALDLLHKHAGGDDEGSTSIRSAPGERDDDGSTSISSTPEGRNDEGSSFLNVTPGKEQMPMMDKMPGTSDGGHGGNFHFGNAVNASISGGHLVHPNIGGTTNYYINMFPGWENIPRSISVEELLKGLSKMNATPSDEQAQPSSPPTVRELQDKNSAQCEQAKPSSFLEVNELEDTTTMDSIDSNLPSKMAKMIKCPKCFNTLRKPIRILQCGHNLCHSCLEQICNTLQNQKQTFKFKFSSLKSPKLKVICPKCRKATALLKNGLEATPRNLSLENVIDELEKVKHVQLKLQNQMSEETQKYVALYHYDAEDSDELSFHKGDFLYVLDTYEDNWWEARLATTGEKGFIPSNYVADADLESQKWYFSNISRKDCQRCLRKSKSPRGTFMITEDATNPGSFSLFVNDPGNDVPVHHYSIHRNDKGYFYISTETEFPYLFRLITHYRESADELCCKLTEPFIKASPVTKLPNVEKINKNELTMQKKLPDSLFEEVWEDDVQETQKFVALHDYDVDDSDEFSIPKGDCPDELNSWDFGRTSISDCKEPLRKSKSNPETFRMIENPTYSESADELCCKLTQTFKKVSPVPKLPNGGEINRDELTIQKKLKDGRFGEVWKGFWNGNTEVAIKILKHGTMSQDALLAEIKMMKTLRHENLVDVYDAISSEKIYIVMEFMCHGSLLEYLREGEGKNTTLVEHVDMAAQIAAAMAYFERSSYIHRSLRARNILVGKHTRCKLVHFGKTELIENGVHNILQHKKFPIKWTPPEAILYNRLTIKSNVWSFGILLTEILTKGRIPYPGMTNVETKAIVNTGYRMPKPVTSSSCPDSLYELMLKCWHTDEMQRPTFEYLQSFFEDYVIDIEPFDLESTRQAI